MTRRNVILGAVLLLSVFGAAVWWSVQVLADERSGWEASVQEADSCRQLAAEIKRLRASSRAETSGPARRIDLAGEIERAAAGAGLPAESLERIEHDPAHHATVGHWTEKPTRLVVRHVTLRQAVMLLHQLDRPDAGLRVERLRLAAPTDSADARLWTLEATLLELTPIAEEARL